MKKRLFITTIAALILLLALNACGSKSETSTNSEQDDGSSVVENFSNELPSQTEPRLDIGEGFQGAMPLSAQLGLGTLLLEDTEYAVNPAQAVELLPLWKAARSLSESETVAEAELEAVFNQIQDTMTSEQIAAISEMQVTGEEMAKMMENLDLSFGGGGFGNLTPEQQATAQAARESGEGFPRGGFSGEGVFIGPGPGGPGGPGGGQGFGGNLTPEQQATLEAQRAERGAAGSRFALIFVDPLIELLEERAAE